MGDDVEISHSEVRDCSVIGQWVLRFDEMIGGRWGLSMCFGIVLIRIVWMICVDYVWRLEVVEIRVCEVGWGELYADVLLGRMWFLSCWVTMRSVIIRVGWVEWGEMWEITVANMSCYEAGEGGGTARISRDGARWGDAVGVLSVLLLRPDVEWFVIHEWWGWCIDVWFVCVAVEQLGGLRSRGEERGVRMSLRWMKLFCELCWCPRVG